MASHVAHAVRLVGSGDTMQIMLAPVEVQFLGLARFSGRI